MAVEVSGHELHCLAAAMLLAAWLRSARSDRIWLYLVTSGTLSWLACYWGRLSLTRR